MFRSGFFNLAFFYFDIELNTEVLSEMQWEYSDFMTFRFVWLNIFVLKSAAYVEVET